MKKMLAKAVALSLVLGGVGFVANDVHAATITDGVKVFSGIDAGLGCDVKTEKALEKDTALANQKDLVKVNKDAEFAKAVATKAYGMAQTEQVDRKVADAQIREDMKKADKELSDKIDANAKDIATNKGNIQQNANDISDNKVAIMKEEAARKGDIAMVDFKAGLEKQERENADKKLSERIDAEAKARKDADAMNSFMAGLEKQERENNDKKLDQKITEEAKARDFGDFKLNTKIDAEGQARVENDKILNAKIDSNAAKVQEQLDAQDNKNKAQDASIKANGAAIKANKDAIDANAAAIKANKAEADATNQYFNSRIENNTANIDKNKVAIENETQARKDADNQLRADLNQETIDRVDADNRLQTAIDQKADKTTVAENTAAIESNKAAIAQEKKDREHADQKLQDQITINKGQIENEATNRANEDKRIEAKFDGEVSRLDGRIDKLNDNVQKVGAMAAAIANLHTMGYDPEAPTEIAVGVGQYRDKTGLALGAFHYPNRDFMLSFSVSTAGDEFMGGIGATWRFGRKSPEELRQAEVEKAAKAKLAKAEAAKKAAKDARVAAQQKRHAEMLAARTGK